MFIAALFATAKTWKQPKCPSAGEWIECIHTMEYCSAVGRECSVGTHDNMAESQSDYAQGERPEEAAHTRGLQSLKECRLVLVCFLDKSCYTLVFPAFSLIRS